MDISSHIKAIHFSSSSNKLYYVSLILPDYNEILKHRIILHSIKLYQKKEKVYDNILTTVYTVFVIKSSIICFDTIHFLWFMDKRSKDETAKGQKVERENLK